MSVVLKEGRQVYSVECPICGNKTSLEYGVAPEGGWLLLHPSHEGERGREGRRANLPTQRKEGVVGLPPLGEEEIEELIEALQEALECTKQEHS